ncbi:3-oxoacyl-[acyl-carrier-protein] reductase [Ruaniaceae bacterium KH17]|nr:3-oxoacyl-[acyl-carrier-protein] reductase [Ruaniaceae bacterium KH17]
MSTPRSAIVTGANRGIGRAIAERLVADGHRVASIHRSGTLPDGVFSAIGDVTDTESVDAAFTLIEAEQGPTEIVVANAGITRDQLLMRMSDDEFEAVLNTNLGGAFRVARRAVKSMIRARHGRIVLVSSVVGLYGGPGQVNYSASKAGLVGMARSITRELGSRNITANVVAPGFITTDMTNALPEAQQEAYKAAIPAARFGAAEDVAAAISFLSSDDAGYISGAVVPVDGGLGMGH